MSVNVLLNLLNELRKSDIMRVHYLKHVNAIFKSPDYCFWFRLVS